jgi:subtilisin family serine protease
MDQISQHSSIDFVTEYRPEYKVSSELSSNRAMEEALYKRIQTQQKLSKQTTDSLKQSHEEEHEQDTQKLNQAKKRVLVSIYLFNNEESVVDQIRNELEFALLSRSSITIHLLKRVSKEKLVLAVPFNAVLEAIELVSHHSGVHWIEVLDLVTYKDNKYGRWTVQSGRPNVSMYSEHGITGKNQIIGYGDSGLDIYNCFFWDEEHAVPFTNASVPLPQTQHRKIIGYNAYMDELDDEVGHGTHVGGTLAGQSLYPSSPINDYNGIADHAKLAFLDVGCSKPGGCTCEGDIGCPCALLEGNVCPGGTGELYMPVDLNEGYFPFSYGLGARIHSNSIGGTIGEGYGIASKEIDQFMYDHPDFLVVWSAGNSGRNDGFSTLTGPLKQSKNALIIAASTSANEGWIDMLNNFKNYTTDAQSYQKALSNTNFCSCNTTCNAKTCETIATQLNDEKGCCEYFKQCTIPIPEQKTDPFANVNKMCCKECALSNIQNEKYAPYYQKNNLATFSSLGPAIDGRIKPDVAAPGYYVLSARAHESQSSFQCTPDNSKDMTMQIQKMAGTSMATPTAASTATLVRDYFESGFYPKGISDDKSSLKPSSALVKAVMIDSAKPMNGYARITAAGTVMFNALGSNAQRRFYEGHGLINLESTLYLKDVTTNKLFVKDHGSIVTDVIHNYQFTVSEEGSLSVTVVWTDPPGTPSASIALVNDIDLEVVIADNIERGNSLDSSTGHVPDRLNNVEKVFINTIAAKSKVVVVVKGHNIPKGPQEYALVISGPGIEATKIAFSEHKQHVTPDQSGHIVMSTGLFVTIVGGEGLIIAVLAVSLVALLVNIYMKKESRYVTI